MEGFFGQVRVQEGNEEAVKHRVARFADIPEASGYLVEVLGREVALFRQGERVLAIDAECPHRGACLAFGEVRAGKVYCPLHAWPFCLEDGSCPEFKEAKVASHRAFVEGGDVFLEL